MRNKYLPFIAIAIMIFFVACSNEDIITEENIAPEVEEHTLSLTVSMPEDNPTTRVLLTEDGVDGKDIALTWQEGDRLQFAIVQGTIKERVVLPLAGKITNNGKTVNFTITLPTEFDHNADFDLYGLYGLESSTPEAGGLSFENPTNVILTKTPSSRGTLERIQNRGDVMLYFKETDINLSNPPTTVNFKHLGSLFSISLRNTGSNSLTDVKQLRLQGVGGGTDENWAYNSGAGGQIFDLITGEFQNKDSGGNYISFEIQGSNTTLPAGATTTLWAWYPPLPNKTWPELKLELRDSTTALWTSVNSKPARTAPTPAGRAYHFYAVWDGIDLKFTNDDFTTPSPALPTD